MPTKLTRHKDYNLVDESHDPRVPLHNEEAFQHGIHFKSKYIGSIDVAKPKTRTEIIVAMRNIRYEFKAKQVKKRKVFVSISIDGVKTELRLKKKRKNQWIWDEEHMLLMHDPIYRIFYVSHDSHDLKIWSYISRDGNSNRFRCNVFKSNQKRQAMHIVRTIGQAFEVCHKYNSQPATNIASVAVNAEMKAPTTNQQGKELLEEVTSVEETDIDAIVGGLATEVESPRQGVTDLDSVQEKVGHPPSCPSTTPKAALLSKHDVMMTSSMQHQYQLMRYQVIQAEQQAEMAIAQVKLLKEQLTIESEARSEAQARCHMVLLQKRELINQINKLISQLKGIEGRSNMDATRFGDYSAHNIPIVIDPQTPAISSNDSHDANRNYMSGDSWFENTELFREPLFPASVVQNDHINKMRNGFNLLVGMHLSDPLPASSSSKIDLSSSSCDDHSQINRLAKYNGSADTSVWTSDVASPADGSTVLKNVTDKSMVDDAKMLLSSRSARSTSQRNGFSISPILSPRIDKKPESKMLGSSPLKWRPLSPPHLPPPSVIATARDIPRIDPPPRVQRLSSASTLIPCVPGTMAPVATLSCAEVQSNSATNSYYPPSSLVGSVATFDKVYDCQLRYDPLHKLHAEHGSHMTDSMNDPPLLKPMMSGQQALLPPVPLHDDIETTVGSILDQAADQSDPDVLHTFDDDPFASLDEFTKVFNSSAGGDVCSPPPRLNPSCNDLGLGLFESCHQDGL